jgi:hypothetical protein
MNPNAMANRPVQGGRPVQRPNTKKAPVNNNSAFTENWVKIRSIKNGIITLPNKDMVTGVKIEPRNIFILDQIQQDNILNALRNCYNTFNFEFWLIAADRPVDISVYTSQLELMLNEPLSPARRKMVMQDLEKADMFINNQVVDTEYYILFKESRVDLLQDKLRSMVNGLASCSLLATPTTDDDLRVILDGFLNGGVRTDFGTVVVK